jgi:hypothetical protein
MTGTHWLGIGLLLASLGLLLFYLRRVGPEKVPASGRWPGSRVLSLGWVLPGAFGLPLVASSYLQVAVVGGAWALLSFAAVAWHNHRVAAISAA